MNRSQFQQFLKTDAPPAEDSLPRNFSLDVLSKGKAFQQLVRQHWRWLTVASIVSVVIAFALGLRLVRSHSEKSTPPLLLFQNNAESAPFSTK